MSEEKRKPIVDVIIPAYNEQESIAKVIGDIDKNLVREIIVVDNNSNDDTGKAATAAGAKVIHDGRKGYGSACLKGMEYVNTKSVAPDILVFVDGDYSDHPEEMKLLIDPIVNDDFDFVIGSRAKGNRDKGSMQPQQVFGNWLATRLLKWIYGVTYSDLGPFRAIKWDKLMMLEMIDTNFGWTVEMQLKAAKQKLKFIEVPVTYRKRIGISKVSGTVKGTVGAGYKIITTIFKYM
ncbi:MAG: glycosyltransferase family 2 protein [Chitinophagales bacterium]|nr:glycosyltransferase family 2 protein [Chitinophagales bacterium]